MEVREESHDAVALVLGRAGWCCGGEGRRVVRWCSWCCGELGGAVEVREESHDVVDLVLRRAGWCCGGEGGES